MYAHFCSDRSENLSVYTAFVIAVPIIAAVRLARDEHKGFHDSLDARPVGKWLAIPIGALFGIFGFFGLRYMEKDAIAAASEDDDAPST